MIDEVAKGVRYGIREQEEQYFCYLSSLRDSEVLAEVTKLSYIILALVQ